MRRSRSTNTCRLLSLGIIFAAHAAGYFLMYRGAMISKAGFFGSDMVDVFLPASAAFVLYFLALRVQTGQQHVWGIALAMLFSIILTALSGLAGMTAAFNTYGS